VSWAIIAVSALAVGVAGIRWIRVLQREHYIPGSGARFALRWWRSSPANLALAVAACACVVASAWWPAAALGAAAATVVGPLGLGLRGRTSPLRWTARASRLIAVFGVIGVAVAAVAIAVAGPGAGVAAVAAATVLTPAVLDLAALIMQPVEVRLTQRFVDQAKRRLAQISPTVVGITGSYGKTTTKQYVRHLLADRFAVVASPASYNNRLGLAKAINESVPPDTQVFVAEMGAYGPGEIQDLCAWLSPEVAAITAIGPVHLERFGSLQRTAAAKAEIASRARTMVINADEPLIEKALADRGYAGSVVRCSALDPRADVFLKRVDDLIEVAVGGERVTARAGDAMPMNVAIAVGIATALGVAVSAIGERLRDLPGISHRRELAEAPNGIHIIDDTYNANPAGAEAALDLLRRTGNGSGRRIVVTPGMIELGPIQRSANAEFGAHAAATATDLVVVGHTNRAALLQGAGATKRVTTVPDRAHALAWVRTHASSGDVVLYENDLPDHYP
jgi:UDP-N-acetylmuramoyl-tripeptide--D-alanyl-D-alanine ligase